MNANTPKIAVASMLATLPDDSSYEDIQYHLHVSEKVQRSLQRAETEGVISHREAKKRLGKSLTIDDFKIHDSSQTTLRHSRKGGNPATSGRTDTGSPPSRG